MSPDSPQRDVRLRALGATRWEATLPGARALILGTVQGLVSEAARVQEAVAAFAPTALALGVSDDDLRWLTEEEAGWDEAAWDMAPSEGGLLLQLAEYGEVAFPPPDLLAALEAARERGLKVYAIDLPEPEYADLNVELLEMPSLIRHAMATRKLVKAKPRATDPVALCLEWSRAIRAIPGYDELEREREGFMADRILDLLPNEARLLVVVDVASVGGVIEALGDAPPADV